LGEVLESIIDFSEIRDFIHDPVRTYSSGMVMRLAFSVAVHVDPDILIIDEVLGVGDQRFQVKCFDKILQFKQAGKSLLFVSHGGDVVQQLCDRAIWLDHGEMLLEGPPAQVLEAYAGAAGYAPVRAVSARASRAPTDTNRPWLLIRRPGWCAPGIPFGLCGVSSVMANPILVALESRHSSLENPLSRPLD
jgi:ABC-type multidrug transport system ATPase subunit